MTQRIAFGALAICIVLGLIGSDAFLARFPPFESELLARGSLIPLVLAVLAVAAALELAELLRRAGTRPYRGWAVVSCVILVLAPWFSAAGFLGKGPTSLEAFHLQMELTAFAFLGAGVVGVFKRDVATGLANIAATWLIIGYAGLLLSFFTILRCDSYVPGEYGAWIVLTVVAVCKISDIGAYFVGSTLGRRKLIPSVSPGKSIEGLFGGVLASCLLSAGFLYLHHAAHVNENPSGNLSFGDRYIQMAYELTTLYHGMSLWQAIVFGAVISIGGQLGDLVESVFKRSAGAKDSASILPGFGGILDMIDSPVAIAPIAWFLLTRAWGVL